jgi:hypothetical protein
MTRELCIAATNAISDVYAMGGTPIMALRASIGMRRSTMLPLEPSAAPSCGSRNVPRCRHSDCGRPRLTRSNHGLVVMGG